MELKLVLLTSYFVDVGVRFKHFIHCYESHIG